MRIQRTSMLAVGIVLTAVVSGCGGDGATEMTGGYEKGDIPTLDVPLPKAIEDAGVLKVGVKCDYPPYGYIDEAQDNVGYEPQIAHDLAQLAFGDPDKVELTCVTSGNRIAYLTTGKVDLLLATMGYTPERDEVIDFGSPYLASGALILTSADSEIATFDDLDGESVAVIHGTTGSEWLKKCMPDTDQQSYEATSDALTALEQDRVSGFVQDGTVLYTLADTQDDLEVVGSAKAVSYWSPGVRKGDDDMSRWLEAAFERLRADDMFWESFQDWASSQPSFEEYVPRPDNKVTIPDGPIYKC